MLFMAIRYLPSSIQLDELALVALQRLECRQQGETVPDPRLSHPAIFLPHCNVVDHAIGRFGLFAPNLCCYADFLVVLFPKFVPKFGVIIDSGIPICNCAR
jgi:hypothetical protein